MKNTKRILLILIAGFFMAILMNPQIVHAESGSANTDATLREAIEKANSGDTITLTDNIVLIKPIEITDKNITINGDGKTISCVDTNWTPAGANSSFLTAGANATLNLVNLTLKNSPKYGVQAYNGGTVILDNVSISDCKYGGVLVNAGTVEVKNLHLGHNGRTDSNNGIEIAKSTSLSGSENNPTLKMNGVLTSSETTNVVYVDVSDPIGKFNIINEEGTENKVFLNDNQVVVTDKNNNILYKGSTVEGIEVQGEEYVENVTTPEPTPTVTENKKDETPKTGTNNLLLVCLLTLLASIISIAVLMHKRYENQ